MRINFNIAANYTSRLWSGVASFVFVPAYLRLVGSESFGLISFGATLLGLLFVLDMGMSNAFARETARARAPADLADLLRSLELVYLGIVTIMVACAIILAKPISEHWLSVTHLSTGSVTRCIALMLVASTLQVMTSLYIGGLLGANRHVIVAILQIGFSLVRSGLVLIPLFFFRQIELFFLWQAATSLLFLLLTRHLAWRILAPSAEPRFNRRSLHDVAAFAGGMSGISLISAINTQSDKLVVSKVFDLSQLGHYAIASLIGQVPSMLGLPLAVTVLPRLTAYVGEGETGPLLDTYMRFSALIGAVAITAAAGVIVCAPAILAVIVGTPPSGQLIAVCRLLAVGGALLAIQYMPYHLAVACGHTRTSLVLGVVSVCTLPPAMYVGANRLGLLGAAMPWLAMNLIVAGVLALRITPRFLGPHLCEWGKRGVVVPTVIATGVSCIAWPLCTSVADPRGRIAIVGAFCAVGIAANLAIILDLKRFFRRLKPASPGSSR